MDSRRRDGQETEGSQEWFLEDVFLVYKRSPNSKLGESEVGREWSLEEPKFLVQGLLGKSRNRFCRVNGLLNRVIWFGLNSLVS